MHKTRRKMPYSPEKTVQNNPSNIGAFVAMLREEYGYDAEDIFEDDEDYSIEGGWGILISDYPSNNRFGADIPLLMFYVIESPDEERNESFCDDTADLNYINSLGLRHMRQGDYLEAIDLFNEAGSRGLPEAYCNLAELYTKLGHSMNAVMAYEKASEVSITPCANKSEISYWHAYCDEQIRKLKDHLI
jgi:tetratricopeptide (TPR) repeat protein